MLDNIQVWVYGTTAVIDTVLLFALVERHNWRAVTVWMLLLALGVWCWHGGTFVRFLVDRSIGPLADPIRWFSMFSMAFGLMLMPSAALHGTLRLLRHGKFSIADRPDWRLVMCYLPLMLLAPIGRSLATDPSDTFLNLVAGYHVAYVAWLSLISGMAAYGLAHISARSSDPNIRRFYLSLAASMLLIAMLSVLFVWICRNDSQAAAWLQPVVAISPIIPALVFAYFMMRFQLLPLILERTLVYGAVLMGVMLFHQLVWRGAVSQFQIRYRLDLGVLEGALALAVILLYPPLRSRVTEALQSLVDSSAERRTERQRLAVQLAARAGAPVTELVTWFTATMQRSFGSDLAAAWICDRTGRVVERAGASTLLEDAQVGPMVSAIAGTGEHFITRYSSSEPQVRMFLDNIRAGALLGFQHSDVCGLFLIGCRPWGQPPSEEELHALSLLVEQFGVTLQNSQLQAVQLAAEHRVLQQEKLSTLGLLAGSLAHEIKNPLSSIKTITRVLAEELGPDSSHAEDLRMIGGEIDRLAASTSELLEAARPLQVGRPATPLSEVLAPTLRLLQHLAREHQATLNVQFPEQPLVVSIDQVSLREIVFNLISNGIEAAGVGGVVNVSFHMELETLIIEVSDTGPGFSLEQQSHLFEPFFTTKQAGTGLGLYIVARRIRELGGQIQCDSIPNQATTFRARLPIQRPCPLMDNVPSTDATWKHNGFEESTNLIGK